MTFVSYTSADRVGQVLLSRPERRNALNHRALEELGDAVDRARADELRSLVVTGDADQFCAGADLKELEDLAFTRLLRTVLDDLAELACPTVAGVSGACMGLGVQLALACDLRIATPEARFAVPVAKLGLMVDHWTVQRLALCAGHSTARWMMLTAEPITASRAYQIGLVHSIVDPADTDPGAAVVAAATELASRIARLAPLSLQAVKIGLGTLEQGVDAVDPDGAFEAAFQAAWSSDDLVEGRRAFAERRPPDFTGR